MQKAKKKEKEREVICYKPEECSVGAQGSCSSTAATTGAHWMKKEKTKKEK